MPHLAKTSTFQHSALRQQQTLECICCAHVTCAGAPHSTDGVLASLPSWRITHYGSKLTRNMLIFKGENLYVSSYGTAHSLIPCKIWKHLSQWQSVQPKLSPAAREGLLASLGPLQTCPTLDCSYTRSRTAVHIGTLMIHDPSSLREIVNICYAVTR